MTSLRKEIASRQIPERIVWDDKYLDTEDNVLNVGKDSTDDITFSVSFNPHILITGMSRTGKTNLIKCLLWQFAGHGAKVYAADLRSRIRYIQMEQAGLVTGIYDPDHLLEVSRELIKEQKRRLDLLEKNDSKNVSIYNIKNEPLNRIVLAVDDAAEIHGGLSDEEIQDNLAAIARFDGTCGIHLIYGCSAVGAEMLPETVRTCPMHKFSGVMMDAENEIVPGSAELPLIPGRMLYEKPYLKPVEFQAYLFDE